MRRAATLGAMTLMAMASGCGGSASETPPPLRPLPKSAAAASEPPKTHDASAGSAATAATAATDDATAATAATDDATGQKPRDAGAPVDPGQASDPSGESSGPSPATWGTGE